MPANDGCPAHERRRNLDYLFIEVFKELAGQGTPMLSPQPPMR